MPEVENPKTLTRRELLVRSFALSGSFAMGAGFLAAPNAAWALEVKFLQPETMAALVQMARDIYPHDQVADEYYVSAVKGYDAQEHVEMVTTGIANLDTEAGGSYLSLGWEADRVAVLRKLEGTDFFQTIRGGLVGGLYNQKDVWPLFGYEGESFTKGGYITRGFDDINWL